MSGPRQLLALILSPKHKEKDVLGFVLCAPLKEKPSPAALWEVQLKSLFGTF